MIKQELEELTRSIPSIDEIRETSRVNSHEIFGRRRKKAMELFDAEIPHYRKIEERYDRFLALYDRVMFDGKKDFEKISQHSAGCYRCSSSDDSFKTDYEKLMWNLTNIAMGEARKTLNEEEILEQARKLNPRDNEAFLYCVRNELGQSLRTIETQAVLNGVDMTKRGKEQENVDGVKAVLLSMYEANVVYQFMSKLISELGLS